VNFSLTKTGAIAFRDGDAKDVDSARTAVEAVALWHVYEPFVIGLTRQDADNPKKGL